MCPRVELYLDLVFVLAVGQLAHLIVTTPDAQCVVALGLYFTPWHRADDPWLGPRRGRTRCLGRRSPRP